MDIARSWRKVSPTEYQAGRFKVKFNARDHFPWTIYWDGKDVGCDCRTLGAAKKWMKQKWRAYEALSGIALVK